MKSSLRLTLQIIVVVFALFFLLPVFLPSGYTITVSQSIKAPVSVVFNEVNNLRNRRAWSPFEQDPTVKSHFEGPVAGTGAKRFWSGKKSGKGNMEIIRSVPNKSIDTEMDFGTPGTTKSHWTFEQEEDRTRVTWQMHIGGLRYPLGKWLGLFLKKSIKQILSSGLDALKIVSEEKAAKSGTGKKQ